MNAGLDYRGILNPSAEQRGRASEVLSNLAGRTFWHKLFDNTPSLAAALGEEGSVTALLAFLADCERYDVSVNWRMPLLFLAWLGEQDTTYADDTTHLLECLSAAAVSWAGEVTDVGMYRMVLVCSRSKLVVGALRPLTIDSGSRVFRLQLDAPSPTDGRFQYSVSDCPDEWSVDVWRAVRLLPPARSDAAGH